MEKLLAELRESGWRVGVHNDYMQRGEYDPSDGGYGPSEFMTFWLLTHRSGLFVQGEAATDLEALTICAERARRVFAPSP